MSKGLKTENIFYNKHKNFSQPVKPKLSINNLSLLANVGHSSKERLIPQEISLSIDMEFPSTPSAETTDCLENTLCYETICDTLKEYLKNKQFHLIEKMARECLSFLQDKYPSMRIRITLHKKNPPIEGLKGGVKYSCGEVF